MKFSCNFVNYTFFKIMGTNKFKEQRRRKKQKKKKTKVINNNNNDDDNDDDNDGDDGDDGDDDDEIWFKFRRQKWSFQRKTANLKDQ